MIQENLPTKSTGNCNESNINESLQKSETENKILKKLFHLMFTVYNTEYKLKFAKVEEIFKI